MNDDSVNATKDKNDDYTICPTCKNKYPDDIIERIKTFKFRLVIQCPYCKAYHEIGEF